MEGVFFTLSAEEGLSPLTAENNLQGFLRKIILLFARFAL